MGRPAPKDLDYAPTFVRTFQSLAADADLTNQTSATAEWPKYAATDLYVTVPASFAGGSLVLRFQADPTVDITIPIPAVGATEGYIWGPLRAGCVAIDETTTDGLTITALWQGGPS